MRRRKNCTFWGLKVDFKSCWHSSAMIKGGALSHWNCESYVDYPRNDSSWEIGSALSGIFSCCFPEILRVPKFRHCHEIWRLQAAFWCAASISTSGCAGTESWTERPQIAAQEQASKPFLKMSQEHTEDSLILNILWSSFIFVYDFHILSYYFKKFHDFHDRLLPSSRRPFGPPIRSRGSDLEPPPAPGEEPSRGWGPWGCPVGLFHHGSIMARPFLIF